MDNARCDSNQITRDYFGSLSEIDSSVIHRRSF